MIHDLLKEKFGDKKFKIAVQKKHLVYNTDEIPNQYIENKENDKVVIGMNQIDLWSGGHQTNRGLKYVNFSFDNVKCKFLSIICAKTNVSNTNTKKFKILSMGFEKKNLCYPKEMCNVIKSHLKN